MPPTAITATTTSGVLEPFFLSAKSAFGSGGAPAFGSLGSFRSLMARHHTSGEVGQRTRDVVARHLLAPAEDEVGVVERFGDPRGPLHRFRYRRPALQP